MYTPLRTLERQVGEEAPVALPAKELRKVLLQDRTCGRISKLLRQAAAPVAPVYSVGPTQSAFTVQLATGRRVSDWQRDRAPACGRNAAEGAARVAEALRSSKSHLAYRTQFRLLCPSFSHAARAEATRP
jgi:hypothetical protein